jgi:hypothetical protein
MVVLLMGRQCSGKAIVPGKASKVRRTLIVTDAAAQQQPELRLQKRAASGCHVPADGWRAIGITLPCQPHNRCKPPRDGAGLLRRSDCSALDAKMVYVWDTHLSLEFHHMQLTPQQTPGFVDRRRSSGGPPGVERRQFTSSPNSERPEVNELAEAVDNYKLRHRRRFITYEELYDVMASLGYHR